MNEGALTEPLTDVERATEPAPDCPFGCPGPARYSSWRQARPQLDPVTLPELWEAVAVSCLNPECPGAPD